MQSCTFSYSVSSYSIKYWFNRICERQLMFRYRRLMFADRIVEIKIDDIMHRMVKFIYSEKATKFCEIFNLLLSTV